MSETKYQDGKLYWLGATSGTYDEKQGVFHLGNCYVSEDQAPNAEPMTFEHVVAERTYYFLRNATLRTYSTPQGTFVAHFEMEDEDGQEFLRATDWGACYDYIPVPKDRAELVNARMRAQMGYLLDAIPNVVAVNYYLDIQRALDDVGL